MKILINGSFAPSLLNFRGPLIKALIEKGHEVHAAAPDLDDDIADALGKMGAETHNVNLKRSGTGIIGDIKYLMSLRNLMKEIQPDLVVSYTIKPNIWGSLSAASLKIRSISMVTGLGYAFVPSDSKKQKIVSLISKKLYRIATNFNSAVIFQNPDDITEFLASQCMADRSKAKIVNGSGINIQEFQRAELPDRPIFLMIARLLGNKGVREYAKAASILKREGFNWQFQLAGFLDEGPDCVDASELEAWKADAIEFLGELDDVRPAIAKSSIYVLPSYREGTPRTVLEAMAMGRPIITSDAPGCRETVTHGQNGFLVPVGDAIALADAMKALGEDAVMRQSMGTESHKIANQKYDVNKVNQDLIGYFQI